MNTYTYNQLTLFIALNLTSSAAGLIEKVTEIIYVLKYILI